MWILAEQKLRDKLAAAAREKMTQVTQNTKEKSLQAERKRKAAMFVNMLKTKQKPGAELTPPIIGELDPMVLHVMFCAFTLPKLLVYLSLFCLSFTDFITFILNVLRALLFPHTLV